MSIIDELFPEPETEENQREAEKTFRDFLAGGSDVETGEIKTSPFAQFGGVAYQRKMSDWLSSKRRN